MKNKLFIAMVAIATVSFVSCQKEENTASPEVIANSTTRLKSSSGTSFYVKDEIMQNFVHYCQRQAGPVSTNYPKAEGLISSEVAQSCCCPTSYMMAAACLAHYKDGNNTQYNACGTKLSGIIGGFKSISSTDWNSIRIARSYANSSTYDGEWLTGIYLNPTNRVEAKTQLETWLSSNKFVLVPVFIKNDYTIVNQDVLFQNNSNNPDLSSTENSLNYIKTSSASQHVVMVIRIDKNDYSSEGGIVTYIDPLAKTRTTSNRKYVSYKRFLNSILAANIYSYPITAIGLK